MNAWLYPVSRSGTHTFRDASGKRRAASADSVAEVVVAGSFPARAEWTCAQNGANVSPGDALYLYQGDVGIFAAGIIDDARLSSKSTPGGARLWLLEWRLDLERTQRLLADPVPPASVRKHVHPRVTVRNFTKGARALRRRLGG